MTSFLRRNGRHWILRLSREPPLGHLHCFCSRPNMAPIVIASIDCDCINKEQYIAVLANCALALADDEPVEISEQLAAVVSGEKPPAGGRAVRPKRRCSVIT